jgi:hypothetical protein
MYNYSMFNPNQRNLDEAMRKPSNVDRIHVDSSAVACCLFRKFSRPTESRKGSGVTLESKRVTVGNRLALSLRVAGDDES